MTKRNQQYKLYITALLLCFLQVAGIDVYAQEPIQTAPQDSTRTAPKARARRNRPVSEQVFDTLRTILPEALKDSLAHSAGIKMDSLSLPTISTALSDSLEKVNKANMEKLTTPATPRPSIQSDNLPQPIPRKKFFPNPSKATWLAIVFPGAGQIYNRKYWKLPIVYGGFVGCAYALTWNNKMYLDYSRAYMDIMDSNPNTNSFVAILPVGYDVVANEENLKNIFKRNKDTYRRYRDMSIFAIIGVYLVSVIDAYVDAELSDFDISPDLSMRVEPTMMNTQFSNGNKAIGVQCSFRF